MHVSATVKSHTLHPSMARLSYLIGVLVVLMLSLSPLHAEQTSSQCHGAPLDQQQEDDSEKKKEDESSGDSEDEDEDEDEDEEEPECD